MDSLHGVPRDQLFTAVRPAQHTSKSFDRSLRYRNVSLGFALFWTALLIGFAIFETVEVWKHAAENARMDAYMSFQKDVLFRHWASKHGGVYVPVTEETQPNPYLEFMPERDITTPSGRRLTLMNPAYMTRQMHELARKRFNIDSHITSLKPIRPGNAPDAWEAKALHKFEEGVAEVSETTTKDGAPVIRFMRPFITEQSCLTCHQAQGYQIGQVRGGISVTVPLEQYREDARHRIIEEAIFYVVIWLIGLAGVFFGFRQLNQRRAAHLASIEALRISEEKFATVFHDAPVLISITSLEDGTYYDINDYALRVSGFRREEIIGKKSTEIGWLGVKERENIISSLKQYGRVSDLEVSCRVKDGRVIHGLVNGNIITVDGQKYLLTVAVDITERRRVETALARNDAELTTIYEHAPLMMVIVDKDGYVRRLNRAAASLSQSLPGSGPADTVQGLLGCLRSPNPTSSCGLGINSGECLLHRAILDTRKTGSTHRKIEVQSRVRIGPDGAILHLLASTALIQVGEERLVLVCLEDITSRKISEQRIREHAALLDVTHDAIIVVDLGGRVKYWNQGAALIYGWTSDEMLDQPLGRLVASDDLPKLNSHLETVKSHNIWTGECRFINRARTPIIARCHAVLMKDEAGNARSILLSSSDITEAKRTEAQLLQAQRLESIGSLAGGVAHDLNNVFGPIMLSLSTLRFHAKDPQLREVIDLIDKSVHRGSDIVRKLLLFGRGADTNSPRQHITLPALVGEIAHILQETFPKNIKFLYNLAPDLPPVLGDRTQLYQVLLNLCVNARDAMPQGGTLTISARETEVDEQFARNKPGVQPGPHLLIQVSDTGTGIPDEIIDKIFDPFFTTKPVGHGSGLGLPTSLGIVRSHGGILSVQSVPGAGATFEILLPTTTTPEAQNITSEEISVPLGNGQHVLVVDDEPSILHSSQLLLESSGYRVSTALGARQALEIMEKPGHDIKIVITDIMMPEMDGVQLLTALRAQRPGFPAITMSGLRDGRFTIEHIPPPAARHLVKPFTTEDLLETLAAVIKENAL